MSPSGQLRRLGIASRSLAAWLLVCLAPSGWAREPVALQLSWQHQFQFAGYYVAKERGYYHDAGLDIEIRSGGPGALRPEDAVSTGRAEMGVTNAGLAIHRMDGAPLVALAAVLQSSPAVWIAQGRGDAFELATRLALSRELPFEARDSSELLIPFAQPLKPGEVAPPGPRRSTGSNPNQAGAVLRPGYLSVEVQQLRRAGVEFTVLHPRDFGVDFYSEVLFTSQEYLDRRPGVVARFREATLRGWAEAFNDLEGTARLIREQYAPTLSIEALVDEGRVLRRLAHVDTVELGHMSPSRWASIAQLQREYGFGRNSLIAEEFVYGARRPSSFLWPDPVRVSLVGVVVALLLGSLQLLRVNGRLIRENQALADSGRERNAEEIRFQFLMDVAPFPIIIYALHDGRVLYANDRAQGWSMSNEMVGHRIDVWLPALAPSEALTGRMRGGRSLRELEVELPATAGGASRWCALTGRAIEYAGVLCAFVAVSDITDRKLAEQELAILSEQRAMMLRDVESLQARLREASLRDALTGLYNRRYFDVTAEREFTRCRRDGLPVGLLVVDADHFKKINDGFGHAGGDEVLRALGAILAVAFRAEDVVCRYGGEEFVILMPGAEPDVAQARAEAVRRTVADREVQTAAGPVRFSVSIGVAVGDPASETPADAFARADAAVYAAKAAGRNRVQMADRPRVAEEAA